MTVFVTSRCNGPDSKLKLANSCTLQFLEASIDEMFPSESDEEPQVSQEQFVASLMASFPSLVESNVRMLRTHDASTSHLASNSCTRCSRKHLVEFRHGHPVQPH
jgi:hypothetical protein